jgi:hypothetical protein
MNIDKDLSENDMNLDDDVLYNFTDVSPTKCEIMVSHLGEARVKKFHYCFNV